MKSLTTALICFLSLCTFAENSELIPTESFFRPPRARQMSMAPDGKDVAALAPLGENGDSGLILINLETLEHSGSRWDDGYDIYDYSWASNDLLLFNVSKWNTYAAGLFQMKRKGVRVAQSIRNDAVTNIVHPWPQNDRYSWVWISSVYEGKPTLAKLNLKSSNSINRFGEINYTTHNPRLSNRIRPPDGETFAWIFDENDNPTLLIGFYDDELKYMILTDRNKWDPLPIDPESWQIIHLLKDGKTAYAVGYNEEETTGLYHYDIVENKPGELIYRDPQYDFSASAKYHYFNNQLIGVTYDRNVPVSRWFHADIRSVQKMVDQALPEKSNVISDWNDDFTKLLIYSYSDRDPVQYTYLDLKNRALKEITQTRPWLPKDQLSGTQVLRFKTKDGLELEGFLTLPKTGEKPYPMVVLAHGGPWARDRGGFDAETQFLANRGYAVLRVNYRGSTGYGYTVSEKPAYEFMNMHEDVTWAVNLTIKQGIADANRLAIMGGSFGGYLALCGAAFEPDLYQCAITVVGVFDWEFLLKSDKRNERNYRRHKLIEELGNPEERREYFESISPIFHIDKVKIPIFIAHGNSDSNVSVVQSKKLRNELKKNDIPHEAHFKNWEGHGFADPKNKIELYDNIADFLAENL